MATPNFFHPSLLASDKTVVLSESEASHAIRSRRLRVGDPVGLLNGTGLVAHGAISALDKKTVTIKIGECRQQPRASRPLTIATAIPKGDRQKVLVDVLTQLGVHQIIPVACDHSVSKFSDNMHEKWQRIAIEACKQSRNPWLTNILPCVALSQLLDGDCVTGDGEVITTLYADGEGQLLSQANSSTGSMAVIIGPEGGFSSSEQALFASKGINSVSLGPYVLRTEAAAIAAAAQLVQRD